MTTTHTPGPWRWEFNREHKNLHLVGGKPMYDLTIMDFDRWGMNGAVATLRDPAVDCMNIMHRPPDRPDWIAPSPGRDHHADWCAAVKHPDMQLIEAAPDMLDALRKAVVLLAGVCVHSPELEPHETYEAVSAAIAKATGATP